MYSCSSVPAPQAGSRSWSGSAAFEYIDALAWDTDTNCVAGRLAGPALTVRGWLSAYAIHNHLARNAWLAMEIPPNREGMRYEE